MVVIKGMKMPKNCMKCLLFDGEYDLCNIIGDEPEADLAKERPEDCPLVEIVTCKDCKYNNNGLCPDFRPHVSDNFYCADAKRRE